MGFWDNVAGAVAPAAQPPQPATQPQSTGAWWMTPQQVAEAAPAQPALPEPAGDYVPKKAISARSKETCPNCESGNYFRPHGKPNAMPQCYECGYNPRFEQMAAGMPSSKEGRVQAARQAGTGTDNFNGQTWKESEGGAGRIVSV